MIKNIILVVSLLLLLLIILTNFIYLTPKVDVGTDVSVSSGKEAEGTAIKSLIAQLKENWDEGDGQCYGDLFDEQAEYIPFLGNRLIGSNQIASAHQKLFDVLIGALGG